MNKELKIYIADDHTMLIDGLKEILKSRSDWRVEGIAHNGDDMIKLMNDRRADVVILDIGMPKMDGLQCTKWIKKKFPDTKVIILTSYPEKAYISQLVKVGADGCVLKIRGAQDLLEAIERVVSGRSYFDSIKEFGDDKKNTTEFDLSPREIEIIRLIVREDLENKEIADKLFLSIHTVKTHRKNIYRKLNLSSETQLASFALNNNLF
jgi:DNA-binding NarL/FixJ family response regulator